MCSGSEHPCIQLLQLGTLDGVIEVPSAAWRALMRKQYSTAAQNVQVIWQGFCCASPGHSQCCKEPRRKLESVIQSLVY